RGHAEVVGKDVHRAVCAGGSGRRAGFAAAALERGEAGARSAAVHAQDDAAEAARAGRSVRAGADAGSSIAALPPVTWYTSAVRIAFAFLLALAACPGSPCFYVCGADADCPSGFYCESHQCLQQCLLCGAVCVSDTFHHCTSSCLPCADGQKCAIAGGNVNGTYGTCAALCPTGQTDCLGSCYDLQNDRLNCGGCGHICQS